MSVSVSKKCELIVALDCDSTAAADRWVEELGDLPVIFKVGLELFCLGGPSYVKHLREKGRRIFLDLKFHDIPNQVGRTARAIFDLEPELFTLHVTGGKEMVQEVLKSCQGSRSRPLGVTVLTSFSEEGWNAVTRAVAGGSQKTGESVAALAKSALGWGLNNFVCSPHEISALKKLDPAVFLVVPGIRTLGDEAGDQSRIMTPEKAAQAGANAIVVGRSITGAKNPRQKAEEILKAIQCS